MFLVASECKNITYCAKGICGYLYKPNAVTPSRRSPSAKKMKSETEFDLPFVKEKPFPVFRKEEDNEFAKEEVNQSKPQIPSSSYSPWMDPSASAIHGLIGDYNYNYNLWEGTPSS